MKQPKTNRKNAPGGGRKTEANYGTGKVTRRGISLNDETYALAKEYGLGNASLGVRKALKDYRYSLYALKVMQETN